MRSNARLTDAIRGHKKAAAYVGAAAALLGVGVGTATASAATVSSAAQSPSAAVALSRTSAHGPASAGLGPVARQVVTDALGTAQALAPSQHALAPSQHALAPAPGAVAHAVAAVAPARTAAVRGSAKPAAPKVESWSQIEQAVAKQTSSSEPRAADRLLPVGTAGAQAWMPLSPAQMANATTIVKQALDKKMGVRSAVIAVATSMQEAQLQNINYGDRDSLGLFQQRPSMGWGTEQQILTPRLAADAFLSALQQHQAGNPALAHQPLWANAQAVQNSGFPFAYAKWETQAAHLVKQIVTQVK